MPPRSLRSRAAPLTAPSPAPTASSTRPRRGTVNQPPPSAVIQRSSPEETRQSIHLTVKADPNKLRKAIGGNTPRTTPRTTVTRRNIVAGKRASRNSRVVREVDSDDEDEEDDEPEAMDVDDDDDDEEDEEVSDEDAEGEEDDEADAEGEEDEEMDDLPPPPAPRIVVKSQERVPVNAVANAKGLDAVEAKEVSMLDDDEDEELSELDSDLEGDEEDAEGEDDDEDAEGEDDEEEVTIAQNGDEDEDMDSDDDGTPASEVLDPSKMTRRQRARMEEESDGGLMALSNGTFSIYIVSGFC
jgi:Ino eighty subunit 2